MFNTKLNYENKIRKNEMLIEKIQQEIKITNANNNEFKKTVNNQNNLNDELSSTIKLNTRKINDLNLLLENKENTIMDSN